MKLIGICGKKQSGKTSLAKDIRTNKTCKKATIMSMATALKRFCIDNLGLKHEQLYGSEEQKNSLTKYKWEYLPHYKDIVERIREEETNRALFEYYAQPKWFQFYEYLLGSLETNIENRVALRNPTGYMTARQIIQEWGTGIFRKINPNYWVERAEEEIKEDQGYSDYPSDLIIFDDIRFEQECEMIKKHNGKLIKLMRGDTTDDKHQSENLNYNKYDLIIPDGLNRDETLKYYMDNYNG